VTTVLAGTLLFIGGLPNAEATSSQTDGRGTALERSVDACAEFVRLRLPRGTFMATVVTDRVTVKGTAEENRLFTECMTRRGKDLQPLAVGVD
jgi:hypothetical protein